MTRPLVALVALLSAGCATLDTSRPIERGQFLLSEVAEQDGHLLEVWSTRERLLEFEVSREAARRSLTESYVGTGLAAGGFTVAMVGLATKRRAILWTGFGFELLSIVPNVMANRDFLRAVDLYNTRFEPRPAAAPTVAPYLAGDARGASVGVAGRF
jgi:hypothetical protein